MLSWLHYLLSLAGPHCSLSGHMLLAAPGDRSTEDVDSGRLDRPWRSFPWQGAVPKFAWEDVLELPLNPG